MRFVSLYMEQSGLQIKPRLRTGKVWAEERRESRERMRAQREQKVKPKEETPAEILLLLLIIITQVKNYPQYSIKK